MPLEEAVVPGLGRRKTAGSHGLCRATKESDPAIPRPSHGVHKLGALVHEPDCAGLPVGNAAHRLHSAVLPYSSKPT